MFTGATVLVSLYHPCWHRAEARILTYYRAFSDEKIEAKIMIRVGLQYLNISLKGIDSTNNEDDTAKLAYNERFSFSEVHLMEMELNRALKRGSPFPILKVIEYLSYDGFVWGRQYRLAGYYTVCMLKASIFSWCISLICLAFLPHMVSRCIFVTGFLIGIGKNQILSSKYIDFRRFDILLFTTLDDYSIPNQEFNGHTSTAFYTVNLFPCYSTSCNPLHNIRRHALVGRSQVFLCIGNVVFCSKEQVRIGFGSTESQ
ncbi:hypothetical protein WR25_23404 isoform B [Diploscapter pachys]|uniref:Uncharacterized protein n=2 Tax=Diploscapter pachys TaxID=2018661 RepID=A0A2A2JMB9_9BILA|nr:hypothetical protein WR25_23404 isoform B [Diploscapter pachys]